MSSASATAKHGDRSRELSVVTLTSTQPGAARPSEGEHRDFQVRMEGDWHVIAMYAPAFVTGSLIRRFGVLEVMLTGVALNLGCVALALSGVDLPHFWTALVLLGVGWNFLFIGSTTLLTETYQPVERAKAEGLNDAVMFASMGVSSASAGLLVTGAGWEVVSYASLPFLALVALAIFALRVSRRRAAATVPNAGASVLHHDSVGQQRTGE